MFPDTAAGFTSGSLCLLKLKWGVRRNQGFYNRGRSKPISQTMSYNEALAPSLMQPSSRLSPGADRGWSSAFCSTDVGVQRGHSLQIFSVQSQSQWGQESSREGSLGGILIKGESIWDSQNLFCLVNKWAMLIWCSFFILHTLNLPSFLARKTLLVLVSLFRREL